MFFVIKSNTLVLANQICFVIYLIQQVRIPKGFHVYSQVKRLNFDPNGITQTARYQRRMSYYTQCIFNVVRDLKFYPVRVFGIRRPK